MNVIPMNKKEISTKKNYYFIWDFKKIYGLGENSLLVFYKSFGLNYRLKSNKIKYTVYLNMNKFSDRITYRNNLRNYLLKNRHFSIDKLKNYKGVRHQLRYPVRGQRTRTNSKTRKNLKQGSIRNFT